VTGCIPLGVRGDADRNAAAAARLIPDSLAETA
jgi:hypothetical protein